MNRTLKALGLTVALSLAAVVPASADAVADRTAALQRGTTSTMRSRRRHGWRRWRGCIARPTP